MYNRGCLLLSITMAEVYQTEGNDAYRSGDFKSAIDFYTKGIKLNCKDEEPRAKLFSNRAVAA